MVETFSFLNFSWASLACEPPKIQANSSSPLNSLVYHYFTPNLAVFRTNLILIYGNIGWYEISGKNLFVGQKKKKRKISGKNLWYTPSTLFRRSRSRPGITSPPPSRSWISVSVIDKYQTLPYSISL